MRVPFQRYGHFFVVPTTVVLRDPDFEEALSGTVQDTYDRETGQRVRRIVPPPIDSCGEPTDLVADTDTEGLVDALKQRMLAKPETIPVHPVVYYRAHKHEYWRKVGIKTEKAYLKKARLYLISEKDGNYVLEELLPPLRSIELIRNDEDLGIEPFLRAVATRVCPA